MLQLLMTFRRSARRYGNRWLPLLYGILLVACTPNVAPNLGSASTPSPPMTSVVVDAAYSAEIAIAGPALISAERAASIHQDRAQLSLLWADDARIVDGRNTASLDDDSIWQGLPAIMDRYELAVFPSPPPPLEDVALASATITTTTDGELAIISHAGDHWRLIRREGRWWLTELIYSTPD